MHMAPTKDELNRLAELMMAARNQAGIADFEGYSATEMNYILYEPYHPDCPLQFNQLTEEVINQVPFFRVFVDLLSAIREEREIKLTTTGNLPVKLVKELYQAGHIEDKWMQYRPGKMIKETDIEFIHLARILANLTGLVKKRQNKISLTRQGEKLMDQPAGLFKSFLKCMTQKFFWGYLDGCESDKTGQLGWAFSVILLLKYGDTAREARFYAEKYFRAWPMLLDEFEPRFGRSESEVGAHCYEARFFRRFSDLFGLTQTTTDYKADPFMTTVVVTPLLKRLFAARPPGSALPENN